MFIHIGKGRVVFKSELIGIFNMNLRDNPVNKQFLESGSDKKFYRSSDLERHKSFIVTDDALLFSSIVPTTLARRENKNR